MLKASRKIVIVEKAPGFSDKTDNHAECAAFAHMLSTVQWTCKSWFSDGDLYGRAKQTRVEFFDCGREIIKFDLHRLVATSSAASQVRMPFTSLGR